MRVIVISNNFGLIVTFPIITHIFNDHLGLSCLKFKQWLFVVMLLQPNWIFFELNKKQQHRMWLSNVMSVSLPKFQSLLLNACTYTCYQNNAIYISMSKGCLALRGNWVVFILQFSSLLNTDFISGSLQNRKLCQ